MKGSIPLVASIIAASTTVVITSPGDWDLSAYPCSDKGSSSSSTSKDDESSKNSSSSGSSSSSEKEKFAPRFDGLRFIETLVTAHR